MGWLKKTDEEKQAIAAMKAADADLDEYGARARKAGIDYDTDENQRLRGTANQAAAKVPIRHGGTKRGR